MRIIGPSNDLNNKQWTIYSSRTASDMIPVTTHTVGRVLIAWFNDCVLGKSGQIVNPIIVRSSL